MSASADPPLPAPADPASADPPMLARTDPEYMAIWEKYKDVLCLETRYDWTVESYNKIDPVDKPMARELRREYKYELRTKLYNNKRRKQPAKAPAVTVNPLIAKNARNKIKPGLNQAIIETARKRIETLKRWDKTPFTYVDAQELFGDIPIDPAYSPDMVVAAVRDAIRAETLDVPTPLEFHAYVRESLK